MLTGLKVSSLKNKCVFYIPEPNAKGRTQQEWILMIFECRNDIYQPIELKEEMKKRRIFV